MLTFLNDLTSDLIFFYTVKEPDSVTKLKMLTSGIKYKLLYCILKNKKSRLSINFQLFQVRLQTRVLELLEVKIKMNCKAAKLV